MSKMIIMLRKYLPTCTCTLYTNNKQNQEKYMTYFNAVKSNGSSTE